MSSLTLSYSYILKGIHLEQTISQELQQFIKKNYSNEYSTINRVLPIIENGWILYLKKLIIYYLLYSFQL